MKNKILKYIAIFVLTFMLTISFIDTSKAWSGKFEKNYMMELVQMRAIWVSTVSNMDINKQDGTSEAAINEWKKQYISILDNAQANNLNTIIFQIRPNNDAFYPSKYNPWSEHMAGYGVDPGWDPLEWMLEVTHERGMEYHAWLNPYRTSLSANFDYKVDKKISDYKEASLDAKKKEYLDGLKARALVNGATYDNPIFGADNLYDVVLGAENKYVLNPASENVLNHLKNTITEIVENYDIDGIHFDDYFYPNNVGYNGTLAEYKGYVFSTEPYREMIDYNKYLSSGGSLSLYNWRRENINKLIKSLSDIIRESNKTKNVKCAFGISPCAGYAPDETCGDRGVVGGMGNSCGMYSAYADLYADTRKWALEEWIDYITPQCYSNLDSGYIGYVSWWSNTLKDSKTKLYIGQGLYEVENWGDTLEMYNQVRYNQDRGYRVDGYFFFTYSDIVPNSDGTAGQNLKAMRGLVSSIWKRNTLTPIYDAYEYKDTVTGNIKINSIVENSDDSLTISFEGLEDAKGYVLEEYEKDISEVNFEDTKYIDIFYGSIGEFTPKAGKKYILAPIAQNNVVQSNYVELDMNSVIKNNVPEVSFEEIPSEVLKKTTLDVKINILDTDNTEFTYTLYISRDGDEFKSIDSGTVAEKTITYAWDAYLIAQENIQFKVIVNDGKDSAEALSDVFDVVDIINNTIKYNINYELDGGKLQNHVAVYVDGVGLKVLPTPTKEGYTFDGWLLNGEKISSISATQKGDITLVATWKQTKTKNGCGGCSKNAAEYMIATLSAVSLAVLIFRKK